VDVFEAIRGRRSVRKFRNQDIAERVIEEIIDAGRWAPSAGNLQPWEFVIVHETETKKKLAEAALGQSLLEQAPVVIVICADEKRSSQRYGERGRTTYCLQDTAAAAQNMHLAAYSMGLATCWVGAFDEESAARILKIPPKVRPLAMMPIGYAAESPEPRKRRPIKEITHREKY
jgi:nitroreductase